MTRDEAIKLLDEAFRLCDFTDAYGDMMDSDPYYEALEMAIKALEQTNKVEESNFSLEQYKADLQGAYDCGYARALEQQPCEDAISRKAVNALIDELARAISDERCYIPRGRATSTIMQDILDLSSVTPQPKIGRWIAMGEGFTLYKCSECDAVEFKKSKYCPNCGAKIEVQNDE